MYISPKVLSLFELTKMFPTEKKAIRYLEGLRWGKKPHCVRCGCTGKITPQKKHFGRYWCGDCRKYFTARTGTPLEYAKIDVRKWIFTAYLLMTARKGISALQLSKELEVSYPTAWYMLHRLRLACGSDMEALSGEIEVDETYIGGLDRNRQLSKKQKVGGGISGKVQVLGLRQRGGKVKAMSVDKSDGKTLVERVGENVEPGSTVITDDFRAYKIMSKRIPVKHKVVKHSAKEFVDGMAHTNGIESVWAVLKRGYKGVYHNWSMKHMQNYVNEFTFRLNEGNVKRDTQERLDSLFSGMVGKTITYKELTR